jgi:signal peptide peptidase SppA
MRELLAIDEEWLLGKMEAVLAWLRAGHVVDVSVEAATKLVPARRSVGTVAIVPLTGFMSQKPNIFSLLFGGTSTEAFASEVVSALNDPAVGAVVMPIDSPGGSVHGVPEAATKIRAARGAKPIFAIADPFAASAAYWLASQADEVIGSPSSLTGSIGAVFEHADLSAALEKEGVKVTVLRYGRNKQAGHPAEPLTDDARAEIQAKVNYFGRLIEADVAKGRRVPLEKVRSDFGEGAVFTADGAQSAGLIDRVATLEEVVQQAARGRRPESMGPAPRAYDPAEIAAHAALAGLPFGRQDDEEARIMFGEDVPGPKGVIRP